MTGERTEYQTAGDQSGSRDLSMRATTPPAEVPGYRLTEFLGSGAFGQVWVGLDLNTGRHVAVKFYLHRGGVNWSLLSREVKNLVQLSADRQVVQVLEVGWDANPPYYVMELVSGGSLEDYLSDKRPMTVAEAVDMFRKICVGLNLCHAKGVLHCDLKPANILLGDDNEPRIADFGQSRFSDDQTPSLGTLFYMAPEQADLESTPDASWDVYALGAIMYRMLTGRAPYREETVVEHIDTAGTLPERLERYRETIQTGQPPTKHLHTHAVDRPLAKIVSKCLAPNPADRYENVQQIIADLDRRDTARARRPLMLLGIVGPLLILLATIIFGYRSIQQASLRTKEALRDEAFQSNQLTAAFAAQTLESEIQRYYDLTEDESSMPGFLKQLRTTLQEPAIATTLDWVAQKTTPSLTHKLSDHRRELLDAPERLKLDDWLAKRLARYTGNRKSSRQPTLATMFVTDAKGTIVGIAYDQPVTREKNSAGKNFCYRTYYHGGQVDLPKSTIKIGQVQPLSQTRLSAAFPSTATQAWKVAVSTPIYFDPPQSQPDAVFVVTINLGDFNLLQSESGSDKVAALVEARQGPDRGTILQHPLMDQHHAKGIRLENQKYQIHPELIDSLVAGGDVVYQDPFGEAEDGQAYQGEWIAAIKSVRLPETRSDADDSSDERTESEKTDLMVLVQYRLKKVWAPVDALRSALMVEGALAFGSILMVTLTLWAFVRRTGNAGARRRTAASAETVNEAKAQRGNTETMAI